MERLIRKLWLRIEEQQELLNAAVRQLAEHGRSQGVSAELFINRWYAEHRRIDRGGL